MVYRYDVYLEVWRWLGSGIPTYAQLYKRSFSLLLLESVIARKHSIRLLAKIGYDCENTTTKVQP
jgi:hypothetical protein